MGDGLSEGALSTSAADLALQYPEARLKNNWRFQVAESTRKHSAVISLSHPTPITLTRH